MERTTKATLNERAANLNRRLRPSGRHVQWQARNGWICLDEYRGVECIRTITAGSKREVAEFLHAMMVGIDLSRVERELNYELNPTRDTHEGSTTEPYGPSTKFVRMLLGEEEGA